MSIESEIFRAEFPKRAQEEELLRCAAGACRQAPRTAAAWLRRFHFETTLQDSVLGGLVTINLRDANGGRARFTQLETPKVVLTAITRSTMVTSAQPYAYRRTLARPAQMQLFDLGQDLEPEDKVFALFVFGGHWASPSLSFARVAFPTGDGEFAPGTVDLFAECPRVAAEVSRPVERQPEVAPEIRIQPKEAGSGRPRSE